jgi:hypothetical protein
LYLHSSALSALLDTPYSYPPESTSPISLPEALGQLNDIFEDAFSYRNGFLRYGGSEKSLEVGRWWLRFLSGSEELTLEDPLADRVEKAVVGKLIRRPGLSKLELDRALCQDFPGLLTPATDLLDSCLVSYAQQDTSGLFSLRSEDAPKVRRADLQQAVRWLKKVGQSLGYSVEGKLPRLFWHESDGSLQYVCYPIVSAVVGEILLTNEHTPANGLVFLPQERVDLLAYKLQTNPNLRQAVDSGWRFLTYNQLHWLAENPAINREVFAAQLVTGSAPHKLPQMRFL